MVTQLVVGGTRPLCPKDLLVLGCSVDSPVERLDTKKLEYSCTGSFFHVFNRVTLSLFLHTKHVGGTYVYNGQKTLLQETFNLVHLLYE